MTNRIPSVGHVAAAAFQKGLDYAQTGDEHELELARKIADELRSLTYSAQAGVIEREIDARNDMTTIYQALESARSFADTMRLRDRIMAETTGAEQAGYLKSLDCLENALDQAAHYEFMFAQFGGIDT